jgi:hypothetical protein
MKSVYDKIAKIQGLKLKELSTTVLNTGENKFKPAIEIHNVQG